MPGAVSFSIRFRNAAKACCVPILLMLVIAAVGPEKWAPRTSLGFQFDHFIGYFGLTLFFCFAWPRPVVVGGAFMLSPHCLRACKLSHRIDQPIFWLYSTARAAHWRRL